MDTRKEFCEVPYCFDDGLSSPESLGRITAGNSLIKNEITGEYTIIRYG